MSETQSTQTTPETSKGTLADTIVDLGLTWADMGLGLGKAAIESTARALNATAKHLETFQEQLKAAHKGGDKEKPADPASPSA